MTANLCGWLTAFLNNWCLFGGLDFLFGFLFCYLLVCVFLILFFLLIISHHIIRYSNATVDIVNFKYYDEQKLIYK